MNGLAAEKEQVYMLTGLSCANCAAKFEKNVGRIQGVEKVEVQFANAKIKVWGNATVAEIEEAGKFDGIRIVENREEQFKKMPFWQNKQNQRTISAIGLFILALIVQYAIQASDTVIMGTYLLAAIVGGWNIFLKGFQNLSRFQFDMSVLMTIAVIGAFFIGEWSEGAIVALLFAISEVLEASSFDRARQAIRSIMELAPKEAIVLEGKQQVIKSVEQVEINDLVLVRPGEKISVDGIIEKGQTTINEAAITGESMPVEKGMNAEVFAGTVNETGAIEIRVKKLVQDSTIAKIIDMVEQAQSERAPSQAFVDRFAAVYTPIVIVLAVLLAVLPPLIFGLEWSEWIYRSLALLVVACPCALVISTPVAIVSAIGNSAKHGVIIKGGIYVEKLASIQALAFDKTGTITKGAPEVHTAEWFCDDDTEQLGAVVAIEAHSQHPLSKAIVSYGTSMNVQPVQVEDFVSITGHGVGGVVNRKRYIIGKPDYIAETSVVNENVRDRVAQLQAEGSTVVVVQCEREITGIFAIRDAIRYDSAVTMQSLKQLGVKSLAMLTGDNEKTARTIADAANLTDVYAELLPEDKVEKVRALQEKYAHVAMVGDGINDTPALATADVGIAMGGAGTDSALETADVILMADEIEKIPFAIRLSRKTLQVIKQNVFFSIGIKLLAILLVFPGWLTLWLAIFADMGATILVTLNGIRLLRVKE